MKAKHNVVMLLALLSVLAVIVQGIEPQTNPERDPTAMRTDGTNADSPVFPGSVTVNGAFVTSDTATIGTSTAAAGYGLTVASGAHISGQTTLGNASATNLQASVAMVATSTPRANAELTIDGDTYSTGAIVMKYTGGFSFRTGIDNSVAGGLSSDINNAVLLSSVYNNLTLRGGSGLGITFQANNTTKMFLNPTGQLLIATSTTPIDSAVKIKLNGGMEIAPGGFLLVGTDTREVGYGATIASGAYVLGDVSANQFTDRSDAPESLAEAYAIIQSHEAKGGKVDHSKLHAAAWGRKFRVVETGKTITKNREIAPAEEGKEAVTEEYSEPEKVVVSEPDRNGRNLSMVISAQALVIADLTRRLEALEAK